MSKIYPIDHDRLLRAAKELGEICDAGHGEHLMREFWEQLREDDRCRFQDNANPLLELVIKERAKKLSLLTRAPQWQSEAAVRESLGALPVREMGLALLREFGMRARKQLAMQPREARCPRF